MQGVKNGFKEIWAMDVLDVSTTDKYGDAGRLRFDDAGKAYRYVLNNTGAVTAIGDTAFHGTGFTTKYHAEAFQLGQSGKGTAASTMAGVWLAVVAAGSYGWIQVKGRNEAVNVDGTADVVIGDSLKGSSTHSYLVHDTAAGTAPTARNHIIALAGFTTDSTQSLIAGDIQCY